MRAPMIRGMAIGAVLPIAAAAAFTLRTDDDLAKELPRIPATEARDAGMTFRIHDGFRLIQAASEPLVTSPVAAAYDADGRLCVVEMSYPYSDDVPPAASACWKMPTTMATSSVRPSSSMTYELADFVVPYDEGVFIAAAPDIVYAKDTDGDAAWPTSARSCFEVLVRRTCRRS
ncbi:MAG: hypothetical protein U0800_21410 [Isosphaeraceae bacterium]